MKPILLIADLEIEGWKSMQLYARQLERWLPQIAPDWDFHVARWPMSVWGSSLARTRPVRLALRYLFFPRRVARACRRIGPELQHVLDHSYAHLLRWLDGKRTIVTVHDLYPYHLLRRSETAPGSWRVRARDALLKWVMAWLTRAEHVIADSEFTKNEVHQLLQYPAQRMTVIPLGGDHLTFAESGPEEARALRRRLGLPEGARFLLHVGSCEERKNIPMLLRAFARLRERGHTDLHLVQIGGKFARAQRELIRRLGLQSHVRQIPDLPSDWLARAYQEAALFLFPSTYEGFGLPVLEAMGAGTPVVALAAGAVPEVLGEAGLLVRENEVEAFAEAAERVLGDAKLREELARRGRHRARSFTWRKTAERVLRVYRCFVELKAAWG